ncbi:MAG: response regulator [Chloroflexi bacterium]|nr:response regulator [Chloroflexota bacterium]MDL1941309.1 response regulator [Chloroflexi bacterium CFX2]
MIDLARVLLVEDDPKDVELTLLALDEYNFANEVVIVHDGVQAMDYLYHRGEYALRREGNPAVILLDLKMPKMDGLDVLRRIKSDENLKFIPIVVLTSSREESDLIESYKLGVNAYVVKPVGFDDFIKAMRETALFWALINEPPPGSIRKQNTGSLKKRTP